MNKKIMAVFLIGMFLLIGIGLVLAKDKLKKDKEIKLNQKELEDVNSLGIINPQISECIDIDGYNCRYTIYEEGGINKEIIIEYKKCIEYEFVPEEIVCVEEECQTIPEHYTSNCVQWETLSNSQIEDKISEDLKIFLKELSKIKDKRNNKNNITLSDEINIILTQE